MILVDKGSDHKCEACGREYPVSWQLQIHQKSYEAVGKICPKLR